VVLGGWGVGGTSAHEELPEAGDLAVALIVFLLARPCHHLPAVFGTPLCRGKPLTGGGGASMRIGGLAVFRSCECVPLCQCMYLLGLTQNFLSFLHYSALTSPCGDGVLL